MMCAELIAACKPKKQQEQQQQPQKVETTTTESTASEAPKSDDSRSGDGPCIGLTNKLKATWGKGEVKRHNADRGTCRFTFITGPGYNAIAQAKKAGLKDDPNATKDGDTAYVLFNGLDCSISSDEDQPNQVDVDCSNDD